MAKASATPFLTILAVALAGCSPAPLMEHVPTELGGLPSGVPPPPRTGYQFPAVHDAPPPRATAPLTDEQQLELQKRLQQAREEHEGKTSGMNEAPPGQAGGGAR